MYIFGTLIKEFTCQYITKWDRPAGGDVAEWSKALPC